MSEVVGALSRALDLTEGQPPGHCAGACVIGTRIGEAIGLDEAQLGDLFYALLLKDAGCSANSSQYAKVFGSDEIAIKREGKVADRSGLAGPRFVLRHAAPRSSALIRAKHLAAIARFGSSGVRDLSRLLRARIDVARTIGFPERTALAIAQVEERWDGSGYPAGLQGDEISILGRILCLAQTLEVYFRLGGAGAAIDVAQERSGSWFDPRLVAVARRLPAGMWAELERDDPVKLAVALEPEDRALETDDTTLDRISTAFAGVVDAKSPYTYRHSAEVARIAEGLAAQLGLPRHERDLIRRAGLLHDIGKLGVSNRILDKEGELDAEEWRAVRRHPEFTYEILGRVEALRPVAQVAANHHERLDGSGYFRGAGADQLDQPSRILAVADVAEALLAERPYRPALSSDEALAIMRRDAGVALDPTAFSALEHVLSATAEARRERAVPRGDGQLAAPGS